MEHLTPEDIVLEHLDYFMNSAYDYDEELIKRLEDDTESSSSSDDSLLVEPTCTNLMSVLETCNDIEFEVRMRLPRLTVQKLIGRFIHTVDPRYNELKLPEIYQGASFPSMCNLETDETTTITKQMIYIYVWYVCHTASYKQLCKYFEVTKPTALMSITRVADWLNSLAHKYIKWPTTSTDLENTCHKFHLRSKIPGILGALGCTHIFIREPRVKIPSIQISKYMHDCNKIMYSIILMATVDADGKFIDVYCGEPGSQSYRNVLQKSVLYRRTTLNNCNLYPNCTFLVADDVYPSTNWLVPAFKSYKKIQEYQKQFNSLHSSAEQVVHQTFSNFRQKFLRFSKVINENDVEIVTNLTKSACVLYNICLLNEDGLEKKDLNFLQNKQPYFLPAGTSNNTDKTRNVLYRYLRKKKIII